MVLLSELDEIEEIKRKKMLELLKKKNNAAIKAVIEVNDLNFEGEVIKRSMKTPVVVDFYALWCMPCQLIGPVLEKFSKEFNQKFVLAKLNVDENPRTSMVFGISSIPAVKMFKNGRVADEFIGALPEPVIKQWLEKNLNTTKKG